MSPKLAILLECLLSFGVPLGWGLWELYQLRRRRPPDDRSFFVPPPAAARSRRGRPARDPPA